MDERDVAHSQQDDGQPQHGNELGAACSEIDDLSLQCEFRHRRDVEGDDVSSGKTRPVSGGGTWDAISNGRAAIRNRRFFSAEPLSCYKIELSRQSFMWRDPVA